MRIRIAVHALDRTGPPMLALAVVRAAVSSDIDAVDVVALRGGALLGEFTGHVPTHVALDPHEPWDHREPDAARLQSLRVRYSGLPAVDATLLVSVAASPLLDVVDSRALGSVITWAVEQGDDLHFVRTSPLLRERTERWLAGSRSTASELQLLLGAGTAIEVVSEFIDKPASIPASTVANCRASLGDDGSSLLVIGAGIATHRKAPDLFVELAAALRRRGERSLRFAWFGGEEDEMFGHLVRSTRQLGLDEVQFMGTVPSLDPWLAAADVFAHTARLDAFPLVCLHAAGVGTPTVGFSGTGGTEEMFGNTFRGSPFPDVEALATTLLTLCDRDKRLTLGRAQRDRVHQRFTSETAAGQLFEAIRQHARRRLQANVT